MSWGPCVYDILFFKSAFKIHRLNQQHCLICIGMVRETTDSASVPSERQLFIDNSMKENQGSLKYNIIVSESLRDY